jgi:hypothetical protein
MPNNLNLNVNPYYDDFSDDKQYQRILFKPGYAVQARELTQIQTILQKQVERFGNHVFKEGAVITGCDYALNTKVPYVKILDTDNASVAIDNADLADYEGEVLVNSATGLKAVIKKTTGGSQSAIYKTLHVQYLNQGTNGTTTAFPADAVLYLESDNTITFVVAPSGVTPTGYGSLFSLKDGIIYGKGTFVIHQEQTVVVSAYSTTPSKKVGVTIVESIVGSDADSTLLDPATGTYNYTAPGADRLKVATLLESFDPNAVTADDFNVLFELVAGRVARRYDLTDYGELNKVLARRTYDESGDYTITPFILSIREHLKSGNNGGVYTSGNGGSASKLALGVSAGKAYVKGYEYQTYATQYFNVDKETETRDVESANVSTAYGNYVIVKEVCGVASLNAGTLVELYAGAASAAANSAALAGNTNSDTLAPTGTKLGTARVLSLEYHSGTVGNEACKYRLYLSDIKMTAGDFSNVVTIYASTAPAFFADIDSTPATLQDTSYNTLLVSLPSRNVSTLDLGAGYNNDFVYRKMLTGTTSNTGAVTFTLSGNETFAFTSNTTTARNNEVILVANVDATHSGGTFIYEKGQIIPLAASATASSGAITALTSTSMTIDIYTNGATTLDSGIGVTAYVSVRKTDTSPKTKTLRKNRKLKLQISKDFTTTSTITSSSSTTFTIASIASDDMSVGDKVYHDSDADGVYTLIGTIGIINTGTGTVTFASSATAASSLASGGTVRITHPSFNPTTKTLDGSLSLGQYDVIKVNSVLSGPNTTAFTSIATDSTSELNTGQTNSFYELSSISKKTDETFDLSHATNNKRLVVDFDYFEHSNSASLGGYFTVDSYPLPAQGTAASSAQIEWTEMPKYKTPNGVEYELRDMLDFRGTVNEISGITTSTGTTIMNPVVYTEANKSFLAGIYIPHAQEEFTTDYQYNLGRVDRVILNVEGEFEVMTGIPDPTPVARPQPGNAMTLGTVFIPPFPAASPKVARSLSRKEFAAVATPVENRRFTMRDINTIAEDVKDLRKYTELSFLEQRLLNDTITTSAGAERPKNGILVDDFLDHSRGDVDDPNYSCAIFNGILQPTLKPVNAKFDVAGLTNLVRTSKDVFIVVEQTGGAYEYEVGQTATSSSTATGTIKHVVVLATDTTTNYTWVRLYLEDVTGTFAGGNTITSVTSEGDPVTGTIPSNISSVTNMLAASLPLILRPDAVVSASAGNLVTLPYTQAVYAENPYASESINTTNKLLFTYEGTVELSPLSDPWFDEENSPEGDSFTLPTTGATSWFASVVAPPRAAAPATSGTTSTTGTTTGTGDVSTSSGSSGLQYNYNPSTGEYELVYTNTLI